MSKNTNELKTRAPGRFGLAVSRLGSSAVGRFLVYGRDSRVLAQDEVASLVASSIKDGCHQL